jgi:REP element-mobilizing transposase RayT
VEHNDPPTYPGYAMDPYPITGTKTMFKTYAEESIEDSPDVAQRTKVCTHYYRRVERTDFSADLQDYDPENDGLIPSTGRFYRLLGPGSFWQTWGIGPLDSNTIGEVRHNMLQTVYPESVEASVRQAVHKFYNTNQVNNLLNIVESPDFIHGLHSIKSSFSARGSTPSRIWRNSRAISGGYLYYAFGIAPLISDLKKINTSLSSINDDIKQYLRAIKGDKIAHYRCQGEFKPFLINADSRYSQYTNNNDTSFWHCGFKPWFPPRRIVTVRGSWPIIYNLEAFNKLQYLIDRFGSAGPASFAWERLPFSFVVDWFVDLSSIFDTLDSVFRQDNANIKDISLSEKYAIDLPVFKHKMADWISDKDGTQIATNTLKYYHREPLKSQLFQVGASGRFGKRQLGLTAALLHQLVASLKG